MLSRGGTAVGLGGRGTAAAISGTGGLCVTAGGLGGTAGGRCGTAAAAAPCCTMRVWGDGATRAPNQPTTGE